MFRFPASTLRAAAFSVAALLTTAAIPATAQQVSVNISYNDFHSRLAPYGTWSHNDRWGDVWRPTRVASFRPYYNGHWVDTREYGWLWVSDENWGDVTYHYGRWVYDPRDGWLWVPGYVWAPAWVVWRSGGGDIGWFPMPPDDNYYGNGPYRGDYANDYGYRDWYGPSFGTDQFLSLWVFVDENHFHDRNFQNYTVPVRDYGTVIRRTTDTTNYTTVNNYVVNRSVDTARLQRDTKQTIQPVAASTVISRNAIVMPATVGRQIEQRERKAHPIPVNVNPAEVRGTNRNPGQANPQVERAAPIAPTPPAANTNRQNGNQTPQGQERGNNRKSGTNGPAQANPQAERAAPAAPQANTTRQTGNNRNQQGAGQANPQTERAAPAAPEANTNRQNGNQTPQAQGRGNNRNQGANGADQPKPQAERAPAAVIPPPNLAAAPATRGAAPPDAKAVVQETRPARAERAAPATPADTNGPGNARNNQGRGNANADAQKAADDKKKADDKNKKDQGPN